MITISLPWPAKALSPNARVHWSVKHRQAKAAKELGYWLAQQYSTMPLREADALDVIVTFYPPDNRKRDGDNLLASIKSHLDGIALAVGIDDSRWQWQGIYMGDSLKPGRVDVALWPKASA
jgi:crossover junction endodeoxyribonuclease RusA